MVSFARLGTRRMIRTKGEAGTGEVVEAVRHQRAVMSDIRRAAAMSDDELYAFAKELAAPYHLLKETARLKRLPVVSSVTFFQSRLSLFQREGDRTR